jgi:hypothetical protein
MRYAETECIVALTPARLVGDEVVPEDAVESDDWLVES